MDVTANEKLKELKRQYRELNPPKVKKKKTKTINKPKQPKLSDRDLRDLMGVDRPTYSRKRGGSYIQR
ncbi:hypothetical protein [Jeotgalibacillus proteolyticus]|uniref:Uncharacterized protein n=1 Tax=Jeotgalibacillus proteolyticus TaxID=2082395 RepID=A0A2S5GAW3_9BACL|nr:hypothetical protein [Jeotgalibacillus proteolyticus]PPA70054.1 hypothetical protein C4B60_10695 [Jeotgalibacillus proteolyticus]